MGKFCSMISEHSHLITKKEVWGKQYFSKKNIALKQTTLIKRVRTLKIKSLQSVQREK